MLWAVQDLASKWRGLIKRKEKRLEVFKAALSRCEALLAEQDGDSDHLLGDMFSALQSCINDATEANSMEVLISALQLPSKLKEDIEYRFSSTPCILSWPL